jgi:hypothetical protein
MPYKTGLLLSCLAWPSHSAGSLYKLTDSLYKLAGSLYKLTNSLYKSADSLYKLTDSLYKLAGSLYRLTGEFHVWAGAATILMCKPKQIGDSIKINFLLKCRVNFFQK